LEAGILEYTMVGQFLVDLKKEFGGEDNKTIRVAELKDRAEKWKNRGICSEVQEDSKRKWIQRKTIDGGV